MPSFEVDAVFFILLHWPLFKRLKQRQIEIENNPYYMKGETKNTTMKKSSRTLRDYEKTETTPIDLQSPLEIPGLFTLTSMHSTETVVLLVVLSIKEIN